MEVDKSLECAKTMNKEERERLIEKVSEVKVSPKYSKHDVLSMLEQFQDEVARLDPQQWDEFYQKFMTMYNGLPQVYIAVNEHDLKRYKDLSKIKDMMQHHVDNGLKFEQMVIDGVHFGLKDGKVVQSSPFDDIMPW